MSTTATSSTNTATGASQRAWQAAAPWFGAVMDHPFVTGLQDGTLSEDAFERYLLDDAHYLQRYARVLAQLSVRSEQVEDIELFATSAGAAMAAERELHTGWLARRGVDPDADSAAEPTPTCRAYTGFLLESAVSAPFDVAVGAVLPCFRVYAEVGRRIAAETTATHPYADWIATYADPDFDAAVRRAEECLDRVVQDEPAVIDAYVTATRFEWMFWDAAWRDESWPGSTRRPHP
ncbi:TenA family protein [Aeromicrobium sp. CTD01-1L150]|uniref:TenA family protein n=1 Tax=Aeromicrobium sp. CTD01-1L150 TaxID=3341830 RepID=UPI0035C1C677